MNFSVRPDFPVGLWFTCGLVSFIYLRFSGGTPLGIEGVVCCLFLGPILWVMALGVLVFKLLSLIGAL